jgi:ABC-type glycerol-3-phosphate transport system permease component
VNENASEKTAALAPGRKALSARNPTLFHSRKFQERVWRIVGYLVLCILAVVFAAPFYWSVIASVSGLDGVYSSPPQLWPSEFHFENYRKAVTILPFHLFVFNSLYVCVLCLIGQIFSASLVAYSFARLRWWGRDFWFIILLGTMMLPSQVTMIPHYEIFRYLGWIDTLRPLIVPAFFGGGALFIFLMRQFFKTIPPELEEAARIDGCSNMRIFWDIMLPLSTPAIATIAVMSFIAHWQEFMTPLIYLNSFEKYTVAIGLRMFQSIYGSFPNYMLAASNIALLPVLFLFFIAQKYFVEGIVLSGIKG